MAGKVYRLPPCPAYDVEGMESWLSEMSAKGLHLCKDGFFAGIATFSKGSPQEMEYRLQATSKSTGLWAQPDQEAIATAKKGGWEYVAARGDFYIYRSPKPEAKLDAKPDAIKIIGRRQRGSIISYFILAVSLPLFALQGKVFLTMVNAGTGFILFGLALLIWIFARSLVRVVQLRKLRKNLLAQGAPDQPRDWRKKAGRYLVSKALLGILVAVWIGILFHRASVADKKILPLADYVGKPPFATMVDLAPLGEYHLNDELGLPNTIREWQDWLAPSALEWQEIAKVNLPDGTTVSGALFVNYYETVSPWFARTLAKEYLRSDKGKGWEEIELPALDVDFAIAYRDRLHFPTLIVQDGSKVMRVQFMQFSDSLILSPDHWILIMAGSIN